MTEELRLAVMEECLGLHRQAMAIYDALEANTLTLDTARSVVLMGERANGIALGVRTLVLTGMRVR